MNCQSDRINYTNTSRVGRLLLPFILPVSVVYWGEHGTTSTSPCNPILRNVLCNSPYQESMTLFLESRLDLRFTLAKKKRRQKWWGAFSKARLWRDCHICFYFLFLELWHCTGTSMGRSPSQSAQDKRPWRAELNVPYSHHPSPSIPRLLTNWWLTHGKPRRDQLGL